MSSIDSALTGTKNFSSYQPSNISRSNSVVNNLAEKRTSLKKKPFKANLLKQKVRSILGTKNIHLNKKTSLNTLRKSSDKFSKLLCLPDKPIPLSRQRKPVKSHFKLKKKPDKENILN